jgi:hypothetical protein
MAGKSKAAQKEEKAPKGARWRLSRSLRLHIRRLKAAGRKEEALALWKAAGGH